MIGQNPYLQQWPGVMEVTRYLEMAQVVLGIEQTFNITFRSVLCHDMESYIQAVTLCQIVSSDQKTRPAL